MEIIHNYLSSGSYGCIISPGIPCKSEDKHNNKTITKFFYDKNSYDEELINHLKVKKIDSNDIFSAKLIDNCDVEITYNELQIKIKGFDNCGFNKDIKKIFQISYEYRGFDLKTLNYNTINIEIFFKNFEQVFEGLCILNENNLSHTDIHTGNIVFDIENNNFTIIDFGLMSDIDIIYHQYNDIRNVINRPFEMNIVNYKGENMKYNPIDVPLYQYLIQYNIPLKIGENPFNYIIYKLIEELKKFDIKSIGKLDKKLLGNKLDVYMLGLVLMDMIYKYQNSSKKSIIIPINKLIKLIYKMTLLNPEERITIQDATKEYKKIMT
jgi:serine/threonine protein kinase